MWIYYCNQINLIYSAPFIPILVDYKRDLKAEQPLFLKVNSAFIAYIFNADGGTCTRTMSPPSDFESDASANPPHPRTKRIQTRYVRVVNIIIKKYTKNESLA